MSHKTYRNKIFGKLCCASCGLLYMNNDITKKAIQAPCSGYIRSYYTA